MPNVRIELEQDVLVKGGKWIERLARTDTVALVKTGTLTQGRPRVAAGYDRDFILRNGACVEEHFTHPTARAIVEAAAEAGLEHAEERHGEVRFGVARGGRPVDPGRGPGLRRPPAP